MADGKARGSAWVVGFGIALVVVAVGAVPLLYEQVKPDDTAPKKTAISSTQMQSDEAKGAAPAANAMTGTGADDAAGDAAVDTAAAEPDTSSAQTAESAPESQRGVADIDGARIINADAEPQNWLAHGRTYSEQRFSPLDQINADTVDRLGVDWVWETGTTRGLEASPIVVDGKMYLTLTWGQTVALDAKTGEEIWSFDPEVPGKWGRYGCCDVVNRGVAVWKGKVYVSSFDGRLFALDAETGDVLWEKTTIPGAPYTSTGAPRVVKDMVIIGNGGGEYGVRGYFTAYDAETGEQVWRFYTVPGDPSKPIEQPELEKAIPTWKGGDWWEVGGGGTVWDSMVYDPELDTLYVGTGNGSPWTKAIRSPGGGDNLYISSILAIDPDTGRMKWYYQTTPGDNWDYTATQPLTLAELEIDGKSRKVIMQAPKNGFFYVLDRETGELISAEPYVSTTWATRIDMETGRPVFTTEGDYDKQTKFVLPSANGGHNWHPQAFSPETGLMYIPAQDIAGVYSLSTQFKEDGDYKPYNNWWNTGLDFRDYMDALNALPELPLFNGFLKAWDPVKQELVWQVTYPAPLNGGVLATAGNLVFQGTAEGRFYAYKADTGEKVFEKDIQTGIVAPPVTYAIDGEQYIAVLAGWGGVNIASGDARTSAAAKYGNHGRLITFKLDGEGELETRDLVDQTIPDWPAVTATPEQLVKAEEDYATFCMVCHGPYAASAGVVPDLRRMNDLTREHFLDIVRGGMLETNGMASFADLISEEQAKLILQYINQQAIKAKAEQEASEAPIQ